MATYQTWGQDSEFSETKKRRRGEVGEVGTGEAPAGQGGAGQATEGADLAARLKGEVLVCQVSGVADNTLCLGDE